MILKLVADGDVVIERRLVAVENGLLFVCTEGEYLAAVEGKRTRMHWLPA